jgi:hypothetical protein
MTKLQALERKRPAGDQINWVTASFMAAFHVGAIAALFFFTWKAVFLSIFLCGYREASASGWAIIGCSRIVVTGLRSGSSIF